MTETYFIPGDVEDTPLQAAAKSIDETLTNRTVLDCPQVDVDDSASLVEFALSYACEDADPELMRLELGRALIDAGLELLRAESFASGVKQGRHEAALRQTA